MGCFHSAHLEILTLQYLTSFPPPNPAQSLGILNSVKAFTWGIGDKGGKVQKHWRISTMWYIKIVVIKLFESKADYLFYWIKPTSQKKKTSKNSCLKHTHTLICECANSFWFENTTLVPVITGDTLGIIKAEVGSISLELRLLPITLCWDTPLTGERKQRMYREPQTESLIWPTPFIPLFLQGMCHPDGRGCRVLVLVNIK